MNEKLGEIQSNYSESFQFLQEWKDRKARQLVLLNNLSRPDQTISSTLFFTLIQRVVSNLYDDKKQAKFLPSQGINQDQLNSYNILAESDYHEMQKAKLDHDLGWDTAFYGRGYLETYRFDLKRKIMVPHVINPLVLGYDPYIDKVQEWRYYWKWVTRSKYELKKLIKSGKIDGIKDVSEIRSGQDPYLYKYKYERDRAARGVEPPIEPAANDVYQILEYFGYNNDGDRCVFWIDKDFSKILMEEKLEFDDMIGPDDKPMSAWPILVKEFIRIPHSTMPLGFADIIEDKHRAKSVLLNLAYITAKDKANPMYWYNDNVTDIAQFFSRQIDQHVKLDGNSIGDGSVGPLNTQEPMSAEMLQFFSILTTEANEPIGTGLVGQPQSEQNDGTATDAAITQQNNDVAQSLFSKIAQFGEEEFWGTWFHRYRQHADALKSKMANIVGVKGVTSTEVDMEDFKTEYPPGVMVYSAKEAEYKDMMLRRDLAEAMPVMLPTMDADGQRNFMKHVYLPKLIQDPSLIDVVYPDTPDEMKAEQENDQLKNNKMPEVLPTDNHVNHIYIHHMVQPKTWATWMHIQWHEEELDKQKQQEQMMAQQQAAEQTQATPSGASSPQASAVPLKGAMSTSTIK